jgi:cyclomaltodextrinase
MQDFIFGVLPSETQRLKQVMDNRSGVTHRQLRIPFDPEPGQPVTLELTVGPDFLCDRAWVYWTSHGEDPAGHMGSITTGSCTEMEFVGSEWDTPLWGYLRRFRAVLPGQPAGSVVRYRIGAAGHRSEEVLADDGAVYSYYVDCDPAPEWVREAVVYHIFVDRFYPGKGQAWLNPDSLSGFFGGRLKGITEKLDYLVDLGVTVLWLSPVFPSPTHHGYDASDYMDIEPRLGTKADLRELLDKAHQKGMRVLLDLVPNHWSSLHSTFQQAISDPNSPYREWYSFTDWPDQYECFFGNKEMPKVNLSNPAARKYMLDAVAYWLEFGVDGFRVDHAVGPVADFWADFRRVTRSVKPDSWTFGEVTDPPNVQMLFGNGMDGCLDFVLTEALRETFMYGVWCGPRLADFLDRHDAWFPPAFSRPSFLDNHDMNRFLWKVGGDQRRLRLAAMCQFTLPGQPVIYHGTEVGLSQKHDVHEPGRGLEEARLPHPWGEQQDQSLLAYYRALIALRRSQPLLQNGRRETIGFGEDGLAYTLSSPDAEEHQRFLVVLNLSGETRQQVFAGKWSPALITGAECQAVETNEGTEISLAPWGGMILHSRDMPQ